jgi:hypothetical protein
MPAPFERAAQPHAIKQRIMALWDASWSTQRIARELGMRNKAVTDVVTLFHDPGEHRAHRRAMAASSAVFAAALEQARQESARG